MIKKFEGYYLHKGKKRPAVIVILTPFEQTILSGDGRVTSTFNARILMTPDFDLKADRGTAPDRDSIYPWTCRIIEDLLDVAEVHLLDKSGVKIEKLGIDRFTTLL